MEFSMRYTDPELIVPAKPTPHELKQLSDVDDQKALRFHFPVIMFYNFSSSMKGKDPPSIIKDAVSKALVYYYPFAGRLIEGPENKILVNCTAEGVLFREAKAEIKLEQLHDVMLPPFPYSQKFLNDASGSTGMFSCPLMLMQVTSLICGGLVIAVRLNHVLSDAVGLVQFLDAVSKISNGSSSLAPYPLPVWRRELLNARNPPSPTCVHNEYEVELTGKKSCGSKTILGHHDNLVRKGLFFGPNEIKILKNYLPPGIGYTSRGDLITAFVWKLRTIALELDPEEDVSLLYVITLHSKNRVNLPNGYYGNAFVAPTVVTKAKLLCNNSLGYALELVKKAKARANEDFIKSSIDYNVLHGKPVFSVLWKNFFASDGSGTKIDEVDFGWGKPIYGGTMDGGWYSNVSVYARFRNRQKEEDGVVVPLCLPIAAMERFQEEMKKIIIQRPLEEMNKFEHESIRARL